MLEPEEEEADEEGADEEEAEEAEAEAEAEEEEETEEPGSRPGPRRVGISDREEFSPANTCWANSALVGGKGVRGDGAGGSGEWRVAPRGSG